MGRYEAGETLASIAKTYDCSPPAISYIISRSRVRNAAAAATPAATEPQLVKAHPHDDTGSAAAAAVTANGTGRQADLGFAEDAPTSAVAATPVHREEKAAAAEIDSSSRPGDLERRAPPVRAEGAVLREGTSFPGLPPRASLPDSLQRQTGAQPQGEPRRTIHLGHGNGSPSNGSHGTDSPGQLGYGNGGSHDPNGGAASARPQYADTRAPSFRDSAADPPRGSGVSIADRQPHHGSIPYPNRDQPTSRSYDQPRYGNGYGNGHPAPEQHYRPGNGNANGKDSAGSYIDQELRTRVDGDIAAFLAAFDAALAQDTQDSRSALREATDRLLRAGARTRIELERLEARVPLPPRDSARTEPAWRPR